MKEKTGCGKMEEKRFVEDAEPYNLYCSHNTNTIYVGDGLPVTSCYLPQYRLRDVLSYGNFFVDSDFISTGSFPSETKLAF